MDKEAQPVTTTNRIGYFKTEKIKDLQDHAVTKELYEECKKVAEKYPKRKGFADFLADDPSLTQKVGAEELGLADVRENRTSGSSTEMRGCNDCIIIREYLSKCEQYGCDSCVAETYCILNNLRTDRYPGEMCEINLLGYLDSRKDIHNNISSTVSSTNLPTSPANLPTEEGSLPTDCISREVVERLTEMKIKNPYSGMSHDRDVYRRAMNDAMKAVEEVFDEYGNYRYPSDITLDTPNGVTTGIGSSTEFTSCGGGIMTIDAPEPPNVWRSGYLSTDMEGMTALTKEERENRKNSLERISERMVPMSVIEDIKKEIKEYDQNDRYPYGVLSVSTALAIIDRHIGKETE